jgi:5-(carboxyamino)imidazole ribonucleotide mutase
MGSTSDWPVMSGAAATLESMEVPFEVAIVSAHRTSAEMSDYAESADKRGLSVIIAGAGGAAHLPGMVASHTILPVIGVPVKSSNSLDGWDSLLSIVQMPLGIPVATMAVNGAGNAALMAVRILSLSSGSLKERLIQYHKSLKSKVMNAQLDFSDYNYGRFYNLPNSK